MRLTTAPPAPPHVTFSAKCVAIFRRLSSIWWATGRLPESRDEPDWRTHWLIRLSFRRVHRLSDHLNSMDEALLQGHSHWRKARTPVGGYARSVCETHTNRLPMPSVVVSSSLVKVSLARPRQLLERWARMARMLKRARRSSAPFSFWYVSHPAEPSILMVVLAVHVDSVFRSRSQVLIWRRQTADLDGSAPTFPSRYPWCRGRISTTGAGTLHIQVHTSHDYKSLGVLRRKTHGRPGSNCRSYQDH